MDGFVELVRAMRSAQILFHTSAEMAAEAKRLEALVDTALATGKVPDGHGFKQRTLFAGSNGPYQGGV